MTDADVNREVARTALERVCSRGDMSLAAKCYAEDFADYIGSLEYHGLDGVERSTAVYRALFDDLAFDVVDQVAEGDRVASRFVLTGSNRGRSVRLWGITISRLRDRRIVEDHSALDSPRAAQAARAAAHDLVRAGAPSRASRRPRGLAQLIHAAP